MAFTTQFLASILGGIVAKQAFACFVLGILESWNLGILEDMRFVRPVVPGIEKQFCQSAVPGPGTGIRPRSGRSPPTEALFPLAADVAAAADRHDDAPCSHRKPRD